MTPEDRLHEAATEFAELHEQVLRDEAAGRVDDSTKARRKGSWFVLLDACLAFAQRAGRGASAIGTSVKGGKASRFRLLVEVPDDPKLPAVARLKGALKLILRSAQVKCIEIEPADVSVHTEKTGAA